MADLVHRRFWPIVSLFRPFQPVKEGARPTMGTNEGQTAPNEMVLFFFTKNTSQQEQSENQRDFEMSLVPKHISSSLIIVAAMSLHDDAQRDNL